jgi:hypothetical protein
MDLGKFPNDSTSDRLRIAPRLENIAERLQLSKGPHNLIDNRSEIKSPKG